REQLFRDLLDPKPMSGTVLVAARLHALSALRGLAWGERTVLLDQLACHRVGFDIRDHISPCSRSRPERLGFVELGVVGCGDLRSGVRLAAVEISGPRGAASGTRPAALSAASLASRCARRRAVFAISSCLNLA